MPEALDDRSGQAEAGPDGTGEPDDGPRLADLLARHAVVDYEQRQARRAYAYGVDLRLAHWVAASGPGNVLVRAVDRAWPGLAAELRAEELVAPEPGAASGLLDELGGTVTALGARPPALWLVRPGRPRPSPWGLATPLGASHGDVRWLVVDPRALAEADEPTRRFCLASAVAHLHCEHGVSFSLCWWAERRGGAAVRLARAAWARAARLMAFSADRGALLAIGDLERAIAGLRGSVARALEPARRWSPERAAAALLGERERALAEFARTRSFSRALAARARAEQRGPGWTTPPDDAWPLARADARLTERLGLF